MRARDRRLVGALFGLSLLLAGRPADGEVSVASEQQPSDIVGVRYNFYVATNTTVPGMGILNFNSHRTSSALYCTVGVPVCATSSQCPGGAPCMNGQCECGSSADCPNGGACGFPYFCNTNTPTCMTDAQCSTGNQCINGQCTCHVDQDCPAGSACGFVTYLLESNLYSKGLTYSDPVCTIWPMTGSELSGASLRMAVPDYVGQGKTGAKTSAPAMFPRQTYFIDGRSGWKTDLISQLSLDGTEGTVEIRRGALVTDTTGWSKTQPPASCTGTLDTTLYREWNATVTIGANAYGMTFALPDTNARYLLGSEFFNAYSEFLNSSSGVFQVYYWNVDVLQGSSPTWQRLSPFRVTGYDCSTGAICPNYGVRAVTFGQQRVIEMSNAGGQPAYLAAGSAFDLTSCGNGVVDPGEQCDNGASNGTPGNGCSANCTEVPPSLRIPGGSGSKACSNEWSMKIATPKINAAGLPSTQQQCRDGDPTCDLDATPGNCRFRVWSCLAGADARLGCVADAVQGVAVVHPTASQTDFRATARTALLNAFAGLVFPVGPGEVCTQTDRLDLDVPLGKTLILTISVTRSNGSVETDDLQLSCVSS
jgi:cysteine-rich repeat protein